MGLAIVFGSFAIFLLFLKWAQVYRPIERTRDQVRSILENVLVTQGDMEWDDFISIRIKDPELENIRLKCQDVNFENRPIFEQVVRECIADLGQQ